MHHPTDRITHTMAFDTPVVEHWLEREIAQWVHPMALTKISDTHSSVYVCVYVCVYICMYACMPIQWRRKVPTSGGGGGGAHTDT